MSDLNINKMKVADLRRELKQRGLSTVGHKDELIDRLQTAMLESDISLDDLNSSDDILCDDVVLSDEEAKLFDENELLTVKTPSPASINKVLTGNGLSLVDKRKPKANVIQNATSSVEKELPKPVELSFVTRPPSNIDKPIATTTTITTATKTIESPIPAKKVKISKLSMDERLALRAERFNIATAMAAAAAAGKATEEGHKVASNTKLPPPARKESEKLKERAERFGCVTSTKAAQVLAEERLYKRKERFVGTAAGAKDTVNTSATFTATVTAPKREITMTKATPIDWAERARLRLERFNKKSSG